MSNPKSIGANLLRRATSGEQDAIDNLFSHYRERLKMMVQVHMDVRLTGRLDPSDVVQDALLHAAQRLHQFENATIPFYIWLRQIAKDRLSELYRIHVSTKKRSVLREHTWGLSQDSMSKLIARLGDPKGAVVDGAIKNETRDQLNEALEKLPQQQREILVMRHLEQMTIPEIAAACGLTEGAVKMRQLRAIQRLRSFLQN